MKKLETFFDDVTSTLTYLLYDESSSEAVIIDPVWDLDIASGKIFEAQFKLIKNFLKQKNLNPILILETHAHADHLSGAKLFKRDFSNIKIGIGEFITSVQEVFAPIFNIKDLNTNGEQFDILLKDNETFKVGSFEIKVIHTPGHTPACVSYLIEDHIFTGDALFMPDSGTGRCDFPKGSAEDLYHSIKKIYDLPEHIQTHPGHDYQPNGRELQYSSTIGEHKKNNIQLKDKSTREEFVKFRQARDSQLSAPKLLLPSLQVNIRAGQLPSQEDNETVYLKIPLTFK